MACRCGCGFDTMDAELMNVLLDLKKHFHNPIVHINSGCRCLEYNEKVQKGTNPDYIPYSSKSQHMKGRAADVTLEGVTPEAVYDYLSRKYEGKFGVGKYLSFVHIDTRTGRPWRQG